MRPGSARSRRGNRASSTLVTKRPESELEGGLAFPVNYFFNYAFPVEKYIKIIALDIHRDKIQSRSNNAGFPVIVIVMKYLSTIASD